MKGEYDLGFLPATAKTKENKLRAMLVDKVAKFMIDTLNEWRQLSQKEKVAFQERAGTDYVKVYSEQSKNLYFTESERVEFATASLKLRMMTPDQAEWEMKESLNAVDRKHSREFYKAMSYVEDDEFDENQASDEMLSEIIKDGGQALKARPDVFERALKAYLPHEPLRRVAR